jgi:hypothetical protein
MTVEDCDGRQFRHLKPGEKGKELAVVDDIQYITLGH